jgi:PAS domain S-box-containing protein
MMTAEKKALKDEIASLTPANSRDEADAFRQAKYLMLLLKNTPNIVLLLDADGKIDYCSEALITMIGSENYERVKGAHFSEVCRMFGGKNHIENAERIFNEIKSAEQMRESNISIDLAGRGEKLSYSVQINPLTNGDGSFDGAQVMAYQDSEASERTRLMFDATPMACTLGDEHSNILDCNPAALNMFGVTKKSDLSNLLDDFCPEYQPDGSKSKETSMALTRDAYETGYRRFEWMFGTASGEPLPTETTLVRVAWKGGYRIAAYIRDLREIKARERKMRAAEELTREMEIKTKAAQEASEAKSSFLASMSHEIRTPMNAIIGMSNLMRTDNLDEEQLSFFNDIKKMSGALLHIINDILDFSKIETGKMELTPVHFDLLDLYDNIVSLTRFMAEGKGLRFNCSFGADVTRIVYGDDVRIRQIITNILSNAIKYTRDGLVDFRVRRELRYGREHTSFTVRDTGIGIKENDIPKLFDKFEQFDLQKNHNVSGAGLGLHITKNLIEMMNGVIEVESEYGAGSTFNVALPLEHGNPDEAPSREYAAFTSDGSANVLVVDDNEINLKVACAYLAKCNIRADMAENGAEALRMVVQKQYDLIFMDHMMPDMDGIETTALIRGLPDGNYSSTPIIALSANAISGVRGFFLKNGMSDYLPKPIDEASMNRLLSKWLSGSAAAISGDPVNSGSRAAPDGAFMEIDRAEGLKNSANDERLYAELLGDFSSNHRDDLRLIDEALRADDFKSALRLAHTLKSTAALVGATRLRIAATAVERELRETNTTPGDGYMTKLRDAFDAVFGELSAVVSESGARDCAPGEPDMTRALPLMDTLSSLLRSNSTKALELTGDIRETLSPLGEEYAALIDFIDDFEFESAARVLEDIRLRIMRD